MTPSAAETLAALKAARKRIEKREHWTQGALARGARGGALMDQALDGAVCWCIDGALLAVLRERYLSAWNELAKEAEPLGIAQFNDSSTHPEVLALFDRAIERIERLEANA